MILIVSIECNIFQILIYRWKKNNKFNLLFYDNFWFDFDIFKNNKFYYCFNKVINLIKKQIDFTEEIINYYLLINNEGINIYNHECNFKLNKDNKIALNNYNEIIKETITKLDGNNYSSIYANISNLSYLNSNNIFIKGNLSIYYLKNNIWFNLKRLLKSKNNFNCLSVIPDCAAINAYLDNLFFKRHIHLKNKNIFFLINVLDNNIIVYKYESNQIKLHKIYNDSWNQIILEVNKNFNLDKKLLQNLIFSNNDSFGILKELIFTNYKNFKTFNCEDIYKRIIELFLIIFEKIIKYNMNDIIFFGRISLFETFQNIIQNHFSNNNIYFENKKFLTLENSIFFKLIGCKKLLKKQWYFFN